MAASAKAVKGLEARLEAAAKESLAATERQLSEASAKLAASEKKVDALQAAVKVRAGGLGPAGLAGSPAVDRQGQEGWVGQTA